MKHVVIATRCTKPDAIILIIKAKNTSGNNFCWNDLPNIVDSKLPSAVNIQIKRSEPIYPPRIVYICEEPSQALYICIPEKINTVKIDDNTNETPLLTDISIENHDNLGFNYTLDIRSTATR